MAGDAESKPLAPTDDSESDDEPTGNAQGGDEARNATPAKSDEGGKDAPTTSKPDAEKTKPDAEPAPSPEFDGRGKAKKKKKRKGKPGFP
jgi:hypothetical protein